MELIETIKTKELHLEQYKEVRNLSETICNPLTVEDYNVQIVEFASPAKWHLAHTTWFFETFILLEHEHYQAFNEDFGFLFNSYYNHVGNRLIRSNRGNLSRPSIEEVYAYRKYVDQHIEEMLQSSVDQSILNLIELGLNHEQQHQELMYTDIKYMFGNHPLFPKLDDRERASLVPDVIGNEWIVIEQGVYEIGHKGKGFAYDNELGVHQQFVNDFEIAANLVTNDEYMAFIEAGGYQNFDLWLDDGWSWVQNEKREAPMYWHKKDGVWYAYHLDGFKAIDLKAPVCHVNYYEAMAFAQWKGMRLPTEFEWEVAAQYLNWGSRWEWTNSAYLPYPNFVKAEGAVGEYNGKFMSGQMVLRGASVVTSPGHSRSTYRNFFQPQMGWQFTGIRLVK